MLAEVAYLVRVSLRVRPYGKGRVYDTLWSALKLSSEFTLMSTTLSVSVVEYSFWSYLFFLRI